MDITELMNAYRECVRGIWNHTFRPTVEPNADFDAVDSFWVVRDVLFSEFVLRSLALPPLRRPSRSVRGPAKQGGDVPSPHPATIMVKRPSCDGNLDHDDPVKQVKVDGLSLAWVDFFDWDLFGYIDLQYHLVRIEACSEHPHIVGRAALIEAQYVTFRLVEDEEVGKGPGMGK